MPVRERRLRRAKRACPVDRGPAAHAASLQDADRLCPSSCAPPIPGRASSTPPLRASGNRAPSTTDLPRPESPQAPKRRESRPRCRRPRRCRRSRHRLRDRRRARGVDASMIFQLRDAADCQGSLAAHDHAASTRRPRIPDCGPRRPDCRTTRRTRVDAALHTRTGKEAGTGSSASFPGTRRSPRRGRPARVDVTRANAIRAGGKTEKREQLPQFLLRGGRQAGDCNADVDDGVAHSGARRRGIVPARRRRGTRASPRSARRRASGASVGVDAVSSSGDGPLATTQPAGGGESARAGDSGEEKSAAGLHRLRRSGHRRLST